MIASPQQLADAYVTAIEQTMLRHNVQFSPQMSESCRFTLAALVQEIVERSVAQALSVQQSDAQCFGDALEVMVTGLSDCPDCGHCYTPDYGSTADLTIDSPYGLN